MSSERGTADAGASTPAKLAKAALLRLASHRQEPTPENFARAYAEESGQPAAQVPERARALVERMAARCSDDDARRQALVEAVMRGRWEQGGELLDGAAADALDAARAWAASVERLTAAVHRSTRQWTAARRHQSLQRVLAGSGGDLVRLQQRLQALLAAWDSGAELGADEKGEAAAEEPALDADTAADWPGLADELARTVQVALPGTEQRAQALADRLAQLAGRIATQGAPAPLVTEVAVVCDEARRLFQHRHRLVDELADLCRELGGGLAELAEDRDWGLGQGQGLQARLSQAPSVRGVRSAQAVLADARQRQARALAERTAARDALKQLIGQLLQQLGSLGADTERFEQAIGRHVLAVQQASSLESLAGVVQEIVADSRNVQQAVRGAREQLQLDQARASELEARVRELEGELRRVSEEATTDALTQIANRRGLQAAFETELARLAREAQDAPPLSLGLIDIDNFKKLNDTLGHAAGDLALKSLAGAVRDRLRPGDHVARFGGEEFVLLLPSTTGAEAQDVVTRLQRSLSASLFMHDEREVFVTFSAGVTQWRRGESLDAGLERADEALYEAKRTGKNRTCLA